MARYEKNAFDRPVCNPGVGRDQTGRGIDPDGRYGFDRWYHSGFYRDGGHTYNPMAAHGTVALVMHEQNTEVGLRRIRRYDNAAIHVRMSAGFPHQCRSQVVQMLLDIAPAFQNRASRNFRQTTGDDPEWLAFGVSIDGSDGLPL